VNKINNELQFIKRCNMGKTMWFVSAHVPTEDQVKDAERMGYSLKAVKSPRISVDDNPVSILRKWVEILESIPIKAGDALVVMGEPRWVANIALAWMSPVAIFRNSEGEKVRLYEIDLMTTFSEKRSVEVKNSDGTVSKRSVFKHVKFVPLV